MSVRWEHHNVVFVDNLAHQRQVDLAWAAGLFEGEGCLTISNGRQPNGSVFRQVRLKLNSTDEDVVRRFHGIVRVGYVRVETDFERYGFKRQWGWYVGNRRDVEHVIGFLLPWLGARRSRRAEELLQLCRAKTRVVWPEKD